MERPLSLPLARHGDVERLAFQPRRKFALLDARLRRRKVSFQLFADGVHLLAEGRALLGRDLLHLLQQRRDDARTAQKLHLDLVQCAAEMCIRDSFMPACFV